MKISQDPTCNDYWAPVTNLKYRETKETFDQMHANVLHCRQLLNIEQGSTLEQRLDGVIRGWKQKTKAHKFCISDDHKQMLWTNHESKDSPMSHGHDINYNYITPHNRGAYGSQTNLCHDDNSTLTPKGSNSVSGDLHGSSLYSCWVCGTEGNLSQYCSKTVNRGRCELDPHTFYPHKTHVAPHDISNLYNR